jgi:hypothetical protein
MPCFGRTRTQAHRLLQERPAVALPTAVTLAGGAPQTRRLQPQQLSPRDHRPRQRAAGGWRLQLATFQSPGWSIDEAARIWPRPCGYCSVFRSKRGPPTQVKHLTGISRERPRASAGPPQRPEPCNTASAAVNRRRAAAGVAAENLSLYQRLVGIRPSRDISRDTLAAAAADAERYRLNASKFRAAGGGAAVQKE